MDSNLLAYYERELEHLRGLAGEFAKEFPKIASRLSLDEFDCADPYVERLLEGFAYLAARVHLKLDAEFPRFTHSLLETVYPHYLAPTPSMAMVQFEPDLQEGALADGVVIPRQTLLRSTIGKGEQTACTYQTAHEVALWPLELVEARYYTRDVSTLELPAHLQAQAAIRIRLRSTADKLFRDIKLDSLRLYVRGGGATAMRVYRQALSRAQGLVVQPATRSVRWQEVLGAASVRPAGFDASDAILPFGPRSFHGYRLLHEYFAFPERFMFIELAGLSKALRRCEQNQIDLVIPLREAQEELEGRVDASRFALFCTPVVNLFYKRADRIRVSDRFSEFHIVPDRTRPLDYEVYQVLAVRGYGERPDQEQEFRAFYSATDLEGQKDGGAYYAVHRVPRVASQKEKQFGRRSSYSGSEVFLSLVDAKAAPYPADLREIGVETLCTNRDLPILQPPVGRGRTDFSWDISAPLKAVRCLAGPTRPHPSFAHGDTAWRLVSHLSLNYLSLADTNQQEGATALRDLLRLYSQVSEPAVRNQVEGVKSVRTDPVVRRVPTPGPIAFARGLLVRLMLDEAAFEGSGSFLLGAVLERFFGRYSSINSFTETVLLSADNQEIMRWPARLGQRHIL